MATYNIHGFRNTQGKDNTEDLASWFSTQRFNIIALQEVDCRTDVEQGGLNRLDQLAERLRMTAVAGPTILQGEGYFGNAFLTSLPIVAIHRLALPSSKREPRGLLHVQVEYENTAVDVINVHFGLSRWERNRQFKMLEQYISSIDCEQLILCGDFNEWQPFSPRIRKLGHHFDAFCAFKTFPSKKPVFPLDRIFVRWPTKKIVWNISKEISVRRISDHLPVEGRIGERQTISNTLIK